MSPLLRPACLLLGAFSVISCATVPMAATKSPDSPASASAAEGHFERLELFAPAEAAPSPSTQAAPIEAAMPEMDHSKMNHSAPEAKPTTIVDPSSESYTCVMHPQISEPKPGNCPICGMALVKKLKEKK